MQFALKSEFPNRSCIYHFSLSLSLSLSFPPPSLEPNRPYKNRRNLKREVISSFNTNRSHRSFKSSVSVLYFSIFPIFTELDQSVKKKRRKFTFMARPNNLNLSSSLISCMLVAGFLLCFSFTASAKSSPKPISDSEIREKKSTCYADVESGMWGWQCKSSVIGKENCALRCLSPVCYEFIYGGDPLEEGERDYVRGQEFKYCMHKLSLGEGLEGVKGAFNY